MRRPVWILHVFIVGLALHNLVMAELWNAGLRGGALSVISAWKEALLAVGLALVVLERRSLKLRLSLVDWLAAAYAAIVVVYALMPQHWLGGSATHRGELLALREDLLPVGCYAFGRGLALTRHDVRRLGRTLLATAVGVAAFGIVDIYAIPLSWWRTGSGVRGWFADQLGFNYGGGLSGLPQNFVFNTGGGHAYRRLVSTFLSPLATSYLLVVALLAAAVWRLRLGASVRVWLPVTALMSVALLLTHSRSSFIVLGLGLLVIAAVRSAWRGRLLMALGAVVVVGLLFTRVYTDVAPAAQFTTAELRIQDRQAHQSGSVAAQTNVADDADTQEHWSSLRAGAREVLDHPQGYGLGNAGSNAARTGVAVLAGESTYTEIGVDAGIAGALAFAVWSLALAWRLVPRNAWLGAALVAVLALGVQTDIIGVPWVVFVIWTLAGAEIASGGPSDSAGGLRPAGGAAAAV